MKISLLGAARTVTGSCYILETGHSRFAIDCGLHQGNGGIEQRNWSTAAYAPGKLDFILVTHAHMDHSGLLPRIVKDGFKGPIYTTPPTKDLLKIMLLDSAHIQEMEALWKNRKRLRHGDKAVEPLYTRPDAEKTATHFRDIAYETPFSPCEGVQVTFKDAGHILGASLLEIRVTEGKETTKVVFSGDLGRPSQLIVRDPSIVTEADYLFLESTYGDRNHKNEADSLDELAEAIAYARGNGAKVVIPAFAVERTQEVLYCLHQLSADGRLPADMPVFVDSPLAIQATQIFSRYSEYFDDAARNLIRQGKDPLKLPQVTYTSSTEESMELNRVEGPAIIISASGMADAGRIKHHLRHNLWREGAAIVFVGFQATGTTGRRIVDGARTVRLFGEEVAVKARVFTINGFSAHAGQEQLLEWLGHFTSKAMQVFLIHGEFNGQRVLADLIRQRYGFRVAIPDYLDTITLRPGRVAERIYTAAAQAGGIDWAYVIGDLETKLHRLQEKQEVLGGRNATAQAEIRDRLVEANRQLTSILSEL